MYCCIPIKSKNKTKNIILVFSITAHRRYTNKHLTNFVYVIPIFGYCYHYGICIRHLLWVQF